MEEKKNLDIAGCGPQYGVADMPEPPRDLTPRKLFAILGPAVIALGRDNWRRGMARWAFPLRKMGTCAPLDHHRISAATGFPQPRDVPLHPLYRRADHRRLHEAQTREGILGMALHDRWIPGAGHARMGHGYGYSSGCLSVR